MKKIKILAIALIAVVGIGTALAASPNFNRQTLFCVDELGNRIPLNGRVPICQPLNDHNCVEEIPGVPASPEYENHVCVGFESIQ